MDDGPEPNLSDPLMRGGTVPGELSPSSPGVVPSQPNGVPVRGGAATGVAQAPSSAAKRDSVVDGARVGHGAGGRGRRIHRDLTTGSIPKTLAHLAWPQVAESVLNVVDQMVDLIWAGRLPGGFRAVASVGVGQSFAQFGMMARQGLDMSMRAMVSRAVGSGDIPLANHIALQAFTLSGVYSLLMVVTGVFLTDVFLNLIGASEAVKAQTSLYMRIQFIGMASMSFRMMSAAALQASGEVMVPLRSTFLTRVLHILMTPFLMFGWWWFPDLGLAGAALANVLAQLAGCVINFYALFSGSSRLHLTLRGYRADFKLLWRLIKIGAPASVAGTERALAQLILLRFVSPFGDVAMAAYALTRRVEMFTNFGSMGAGQAAGIMVGQNLGAGRPDRAKQSVGWALLYVTAANTILAGVIALFPVLFITLFTSQADTVELAKVWLRIQVIASVFMGSTWVFQQAYNTAGDTLAPMVITLLAVWGVELPLAWVLTRYTDIGVIGIGFAAIAGMMSRVLLFGPYFFWGRWLRVKVI